MIKLLILHAFIKKLVVGLADKVLKPWCGGSCVRIPDQLFSTRKYFTILFKILDFLRSLDRFKVHIRAIISEFYMAWRNNFTKIFTYGRGGRSV